MMDELVAFLKARYDDERAVAERLAARYVYPADHELAGQSYWPRPTVRRAAERSDEDAAALIGAFSPACVLAEVEAKRALLDDLLAEPHDAIPGEPFHSCRATVQPGELGDLETGMCTCGRDARVARRVRLLASPYANHPDYQEAWRP